MFDLLNLLNLIKLIKWIKIAKKDHLFSWIINEQQFSWENPLLCTFLSPIVLNLHAFNRVATQKYDEIQVHLSTLSSTISFFQYSRPKTLFSFFTEYFWLGLLTPCVVGKCCKRCSNFDFNKLTLRIESFGEFQKKFFFSFFAENFLRLGLWHPCSRQILQNVLRFRF